MFRRIRATALSKRHDSCQRRRRRVQAVQRLQAFTKRLWPSAPPRQRPWFRRFIEDSRDEKTSVARPDPAPPGYYDYDDVEDDVNVCSLHCVDRDEDDKLFARAAQQYEQIAALSDDRLKKYLPDMIDGTTKCYEKEAVAADVKEEGKNEEDLMSMSEEIASFREVADLVSDMVAAEEGRAIGRKK